MTEEDMVVAVVGMITVLIQRELRNSLISLR